MTLNILPCTPVVSNSDQRPILQILSNAWEKSTKQQNNLFSFFQYINKAVHGE